MAQAPAVQQRPAHPTIVAVQQLLGANMKAIQSCLPKHLTPERMCRVAFNTVQKTPALLKCTPHSLLAAIVEASSLGLEIDGRGLAYLVPYGETVTLIPGYKGLMQLAYNSGRVAGFCVEVVCKNDTFDFSLGLDPRLVHIPNLEDRGEMYAAYAVGRIKDNDPAFVVLGRSEVLKIRNASPGAKKADSPWNKWEEEMWKKTAIRRLCKYLPLSPEMQRAVLIDELAEAGKPQELGLGLIDLDPEAPGSFGKDTGPDLAALDRFNKHAAELHDDDINLLGEFLEATATANGTDLNRVKASAADRFPEFLASFNAWKAKHVQEETYACPDEDGIRIKASVCAICPKAKDCPEYGPSH